MGRRGAVVSAHPWATRAGLAVLNSGGNAFDSALAVSAALTVLEPDSNGIGGDGFFTLWHAEDERASVIHAAAPAPLAAKLCRFANGIPQRGGLAAMPPGLGSAWHLLLERYTSRPAQELVKPAVQFARDGVPASHHFSTVVRDNMNALLLDPVARQIFLPGGTPLLPGQSFRNPRLADTLESLALGGRGDFYEGELAKTLVEFVNSRGGLWCRDDLSTYAATEHEALSMNYRGLSVFKCGARRRWGSRCCLLLGFSEHFDLSAVGAGSADWVHSLVEIKKNRVH